MSKPPIHQDSWSAQVNHAPLLRSLKALELLSLKKSKYLFHKIMEMRYSWHLNRCRGVGGELNVDRRFDAILIVESTIIFRNSCRFVDRLS